jgi:hypothetical protein
MATQPAPGALKDDAICRFLRERTGELADGARSHYDRSGRGAWMADLGSPAPWHIWIGGNEYAAHAAIGDLPPAMAEQVTALIGSYDPRCEFVLIAVHPDGRCSWQTVGAPATRHLAS